MSNPRKKFSAEEKVKILRLHLLENQPVSDICDRHGLNPNIFYRWQKLFFENGAAVFNQAANGRKDIYAKEREGQNPQLKAKLAGKDEVIAEIMASHVQLKKSLGQV